jgi:hypothetical protein
VIADGKEAWSSGKMTIDDIAKETKLDIKNVSSLTLKVCDANSGRSFWKNHAIWADPEMRK